jgi:hypothetical protein
MQILLTILQWLTNTGLGISTLVTLVLAALLKIMPRDKLWTIVKPSAIAVGFFINTLLLKLLPKKDAIKVEEGVFCTLTYVGRMWFQEVEATILSDNVDGISSGDVVINKTKSIVSKYPDSAKSDNRKW